MFSSGCFILGFRISGLFFETINFTEEILTVEINQVLWALPATGPVVTFGQPKYRLPVWDSPAFSHPWLHIAVSTSGNGARKTKADSFLSPLSAPSWVEGLSWSNTQPPAQPKGGSKNVQPREWSHLVGAAWIYVIWKQSGNCSLSLHIEDLKLLRFVLVKWLIFTVTVSMQHCSLLHCLSKIMAVKEVTMFSWST